MLILNDVMPIQCILVTCRNCSLIRTSYRLALIPKSGAKIAVEDKSKTKSHVHVYQRVGRLSM